MRKYMITAAVALVAFAGQAIASEGIGAFAPQFGNVSYNAGDRSGSDSDGQDNVLSTAAIALIGVAVVGAGVGIGVAVSGSDKPASA